MHQYCSEVMLLLTLILWSFNLHSNQIRFQPLSRPEHFYIENRGFWWNPEVLRVQGRLRTNTHGKAFDRSRHHHYSNSSSSSSWGMWLIKIGLKGRVFHKYHVLTLISTRRCRWVVAALQRRRRRQLRARLFMRVLKCLFETARVCACARCSWVFVE